ncbi:hypothetical protein N0V83_000073 [Neocucurbitaria cava]|uniref:Uncharacterized protein n=1 Tax=Neocucurbitaria cava TaxID=798079 RepID=A0A9W8YIP3_9PLEO|nr:hypothetical protein N0V83_000073 [Neocucurbitaria cava]
MNLFNTAFDYIMDTATDFLKKKPAYNPAKPNRVDADTSLLQYHQTGTGPKPAPASTSALPLRTLRATNLFSDLHAAQTHAYYEEIDSIPAVSVGLKSAFSAGHWYVVHPVTAVDVLFLSTRVLQDLAKWLEKDCPNELFEGEGAQVRDFKGVRSETAENVKRELQKREERGDVGKEEGYTGIGRRLGMREKKRRRRGSYDQDEKDEMKDDMDIDWRATDDMRGQKRWHVSYRKEDNTLYVQVVRNKRVCRNTRKMNVSISLGSFRAWMLMENVRETRDGTYAR